jgi:hypothetical protein
MIRITRGITSRIPVLPSRRTTAPSSRYLSAFGSGSAEVSISTSERSSSGRRSASRIPMKPPMESPTKWHGAAPSTSISAAASAESVSMS